MTRNLSLKKRKADSTDSSPECAGRWDCRRTETKNFLAGKAKSAKALFAFTEAFLEPFRQQAKSCIYEIKIGARKLNTTAVDFEDKQIVHCAIRSDNQSCSFIHAFVAAQNIFLAICFGQFGNARKKWRIPCGK
jgi:hypothetical protein